MKGVLACSLLAAALAMRPKLNTKAKYVTGAINVHLVPHSHDDVGWLKTVDEYSTGSNNTIQHANTGLTIDTVLECLTANPDRHFIYVEQAFFQRWWESADSDQQDAMRRVIANGQMEFINGGWCMHDEAAPSYVDMLDQTTLGHRLIKTLFGVVPRATWQIDPFGHSASQASLLSSPLAGFESLYFGRISYQDRALRINETRLEHIWRASPNNLGVSGQVWTDVMPGYGPPTGELCWDEQGCGNSEPINDDEALEDYNVPYFVNLTVTQASEWAANYLTPDGSTYHIMWSMGSDFQYTNARGWYKNLDKLINYVNAGTAQHGVNLLYSTPSIYADAKLAQDVKWSLKTDDFMPYDDGPHAMWTGYFTSRPALKGYVRDSSSVFQASKQLQFLTGGPTDMGPNNPLFRLERAMGVTQHHDAVSGTSKQHVAYDYARRLAWGREDADAGNAAALQILTGDLLSVQATCDLSNATICPALESPVAGSPVLVTIYNQQAQAAAAMPIRLAVAMPSGITTYSVIGPTGSAVVAQIIPATASDISLRVDYYLAAPTPMAWLVFQAAVPAMGHVVYFITPSNSGDDAPKTHISVRRRMTTSRAGLGGRAQDSTLTNGVISLTISSATGLVSSYTSRAGTFPLVQTFGYYNSSWGGDAPNDGTSDKTQSSGAYIFRTNSSIFFPISASPAVVDIVTGPIVNEAQQVVAAGWVTAVTRLWAGAATADFEWTVGPIKNGPSPQGKEVCARYAAGMDTRGTWATDSNLREMQTRVRDFRPSWNYTVFEEIGGNYYPVNGRITTKDATTGATMSVSTDRTQGGSSIVDGSIELMVHRRLQHDDSRGVGEPINEPGLDASGTGLIVRGIHRLSIDMAANAPAVGKAALQDMTFRPLVTYSALHGGLTPATWLAKFFNTSTGLTAPLPANVHLLTVHALSPTVLVLRLAHLFETGEDPVNSLPASVNLTTLFTEGPLGACVEMTLPNSQPLAGVKVRTIQIVGEGAVTYPVIPAAPAGPAQTIVLAPMAIRTFTCAWVGATRA